MGPRGVVRQGCPTGGQVSGSFFEFGDCGRVNLQLQKRDVGFGSPRRRPAANAAKRFPCRTGRDWTDLADGLWLHLGGRLQVTHGRSLLCSYRNFQSRLIHDPRLSEWEQHGACQQFQIRGEIRSSAASVLGIEFVKITLPRTVHIVCCPVPLRVQPQKILPNHPRQRTKTTPPSACMGTKAPHFH